MEYQLINT